LKELAKDKTKTPEERFAARLKLAEMPRNGSKVRIRNRCAITGRPRGTRQGEQKLGVVVIAVRRGQPGKLEDAGHARALDALQGRDRGGLGAGKGGNFRQQRGKKEPGKEIHKDCRQPASRGHR
jgi:ribosomal protein S14